jgi:uncharacterized C2H2 Zn-finger protein
MVMILILINIFCLFLGMAADSMFQDDFYLATEGDNEDPFNPWAVSNIEVFHFYNCPECDERYLMKSEFRQHAVNSHPKAKVLFDVNNIDLVAPPTTTTSENCIKEDPDFEPAFDDNESYINKNWESDTEEEEYDDKEDLHCLLSSESSNSRKAVKAKSKHHKCPVCEKKLSSVDKLKWHMSSKHQQDDETSEKDKEMKIYKCPECEFSTHTQKNLSQHVFVRHRKDEHRFICDQCSKRFPTNFLLKQHVDILHKGLNKRHMCEKCGKGFAYKNGIKDHPCRPGHVQKDVQCDKCDHVFKREMDYLQHHKSQHGGFPAHLEHKVKFLCDACPAAYTTYVGLYLHRRKNHSLLGKDMVPKSPRQVHTCSDCGKEYNNKKNLVDHRY